ncbi:MAG: Beta-lactamase domain protein [Chloroflexi bacterium]|nr:Beta-lactamase domain protein [Chloroflexota bacterium]
MQAITKNVYVETGFRGCNTGLVVTTRGVVVIDTPMVPYEAKEWKKEASRHGPVRYIINTEPHTDHASGNCWFGAPVISHEGTRIALAAAQVKDLVNALGGMAPEALPLDSDFRYQLPEITFSQKLSFFLGEHSFHLINLPGHTLSEIAVYVPEEKVIFTGDNLNLRMPIFIKSDPLAWLESLKQLQSFAADRLVPGHGVVSDMTRLPWMMDQVELWLKSVQSAISQGMPLEKMLKKVNMAEKYPQIQDPWMHQIMRHSLADLYQYLTTHSRHRA